MLQDKFHTYSPMEKVSHRLDYDAGQALACTYETTTNAGGNI
jgi:hypothetical protein